MKKLIKKLLREHLNENNYIDAALDNLERVKDFNKLSEIDKLILLAPSRDISKLKRLSFHQIFKDLGGTFGNLKLKVKIKDVNEQLIDHKFSKECAGKEGYLSSYIFYPEDNYRDGYVTVRFNEFVNDPDMKGGGTYNEYPIFLANMYPLDYNDTLEDFVKYQNRRDQDAKEFMDHWNDIMGPDDDGDY